MKEVIQVTERLSGKKVPVQYGSRRIGDPPCLVGGRCQQDSPKLGLDAALRRVGTDHCACLSVGSECGTDNKERK